jgi:hypothetical protein
MVLLQKSVSIPLGRFGLVLTVFKGEPLVVLDSYVLKIEVSVAEEEADGFCPAFGREIRQFVRWGHREEDRYYCTRLDYLIGTVQGNQQV